MSVKKKVKWKKLRTKNGKFKNIRKIYMWVKKCESIKCENKTC